MQQDKEITETVGNDHFNPKKVSLDNSGLVSVAKVGLGLGLGLVLGLGLGSGSGSGSGLGLR